jgi:hypothetical protein
MANTSFAITPDTPNVLFIASQSGPIARVDALGAAITRGTVILNAATPLALTLAAPKAGPQMTGGEDGNILTIINIQDCPLTGSGHTITAPTNSIRGAGSTLTFTTVSAETISLIAYGGVWYPFGGDVLVS